MYDAVGFLGTGNMGSAVARAVYRSGEAKQIWLANRTPAKAEALAAQLPGAGVCTNRELVDRCDVIFLGVKPQMMEGVIRELRDGLKASQKRRILVSMAAGLSCERLSAMLGQTTTWIRMMPNTPAAIGAGVVQYCGLWASQEDLDAFARLIAPAGLVDQLDEKLMDAATCVSGCGPAFACLFAEALADGGVACGLPRDKAVEYAAKMLEGTARLLLESGKHPGALKDAVCSPGGTTIQGVRRLEEQGVRGAVMDAVMAAYEKTLAL